MRGWPHARQPFGGALVTAVIADPVAATVAIDDFNPNANTSDQQSILSAKHQ